MIFKQTATAILILALISAAGTSARREGGGGGGNRGSGSRDGRGGGRGGNRSGRDSRGDGIPGQKRIIFPDEDFEFPSLELANITCTAEFSCMPRHRGRGGGDVPEAEGVFVCRTRYNPLTGDSDAKPMCLPTDKAWDSDVCGCCGEDCPEQPDFVDSTCANSDLIPDSIRPPERKLGGRGGGGDRGGRDRVREDQDVVCREVYNPFTGEVGDKTVPTPADEGLEGDVCGCCNDECPASFRDETFDKPLLMNSTCDVEETITCTIPKRQGGRGGHGGKNRNIMDSDEDDEEDEPEDKTGLFVCREKFDRITGQSMKRPECIADNAAWETDECGCCGEDCPTSPKDQFQTLTCEAEEFEPCQLHSGEEGQFVCRSLFNPQDGEVLIKESVCIPTDRAFDSDECGCCDDTLCPAAPEDGFNDEDNQLMSTFLAPEGGITASNALETDGSGGSRFASGIQAIIMTGLGFAFFV